MYIKFITEKREGTVFFTPLKRKVKWYSLKSSRTSGLWNLSHGRRYWPWNLNEWMCIRCLGDLWSTLVVNSPGRWKSKVTDTNTTTLEPTLRCLKVKGVSFPSTKKETKVNRLPRFFSVTKSLRHRKNKNTNTDLIKVRVMCSLNFDLQR